MESEKEFLESYDLSKYDRPSVTADVAAFMIRTEDKTPARGTPVQGYVGAAGRLFAAG